MLKMVVRALSCSCRLAPKDFEKKPTRKKRSSGSDEHTLTKTERMVAKRDLEALGNTSFASFLNSQVETRFCNLGVFMARDDSELISTVVSMKNIEVHRLTVYNKGKNITKLVFCHLGDDD